MVACDLETAVRVSQVEPRGFGGRVESGGWRDGQGTGLYGQEHFIFAKIRARGTKFKLKHKECSRIPLNANVSKQWSKLVTELVKELMGALSPIFFFFKDQFLSL